MRGALPAWLFSLSMALSVAAQGPQTTLSISGAKLGTVPAAVYAQVPKLPKGKGVLVLDVAPESAAAAAGLKRYDILLSVGNGVLDSRDSISLRKEEGRIVVVRGGETVTLNLVPRVPRKLAEIKQPESLKAVLKPGAPPAVNVEAKPLEGNRLRVTFTYFADGTSKLERVDCSGSVDELKKTVKDLAQQKRMSAEVQDLADCALERLRSLNSVPKK